VSIRGKGKGFEFTLEDVEKQGGLAPQKGKVFVNSLVKLGYAELHRSAAGIAYILK
jgi:hypothetical protein